jgi:hypothetical protein
MGVFGVAQANFSFMKGTNDWIKTAAKSKTLSAIVEAMRRNTNNNNNSATDGKNMP